MWRAKSTWAALVLALAVVIAMVLFGAREWVAIGANEISPIGWVVFLLGAIVTFAVGGGLMALVFISNRYGYDDGSDPGPR